jgi:hypothetical protein
MTSQELESRSQNSDEGRREWVVLAESHLQLNALLARFRLVRAQITVELRVLFEIVKLDIPVVQVLLSSIGVLGGGGSEALWQTQFWLGLSLP